MDIIHVAVWKKGDERTTYNLVYVDGKTGTTYAKRFNVTAITRDKEYDLTKDGSKGSKVLYFTMQPNGESEVLNITLHLHLQQGSKYLITTYQKLPSGQELTGQHCNQVSGAQGNTGECGSVEPWRHEGVYRRRGGRLNTDGRGRLLGAFDTG